MAGLRLFRGGAAIHSELIDAPIVTLGSTVVHVNVILNLPL